MSARIAIVVAVAENGVIGRDGSIPWRLPGDLKHFRSVTMGKPLIMGRKTFDSIGKPLDGRDNIVLTRDTKFRHEGVTTVTSVEDAVHAAQRFAAVRKADEIAVIGGGDIYNLMMPHADRIYLTRVHGRPEGDTFFAVPDPTDWQVRSEVRHRAGPKDSSDFSIILLDRRRSGAVQ
ncbi:MAG: dihydrofolate reductase [Pseudomonadota bacterium]|nr:dihydrofolate reductase [Pseudomonadota bacterium]